MRSAAVVMIYELEENTTQMSFIDYQDVVETLLTNSLDPTLTEGIGIGCLNGRGNDMDTFRLKNSIESIRVLGVVISNQATKVVFRLLKLPDKLSGLLSYPQTIRVRSDPSQMNSSRTQFDKNQHIHRSQKNRLNGKEIAGE